MPNLLAKSLGVAIFYLKNNWLKFTKPHCLTLTNLKKVAKKYRQNCFS